MGAKVSGAKSAREVYKATGDVEVLTTRLAKQGARELAAQYAFWINPVDQGRRTVEGGNERLEKQIERDVRRVFKVAEEVQDQWGIYVMIKQANPKLAGWAMRLVKAGKGDELRSLAMRAGVPRGIDEGLYAVMRGDRGYISDSALPQSMVTKGARDRKLAKQLKRVGLAKASWWQAARAVSTGRLRITLETGSSVERFSKAVKAAGRGVEAGSAQVVEGLLARVSITSRLDYVEDAFARGGRQRAENRAAMKNEEDIVKALIAMERRAQRQLSRRVA